MTTSSFSIHTIKNKTGFTLVELILFMGLMSILLTLLMNLFASIVDLRLETEATSSTEQDAKFIYSRLQYDIQRATTILTPPNPGETNSTLSLSIGSETYTYLLNNGNLQLTNTTGTSNINSYNTTLSNISFEHLENNRNEKAIQVTYTISSDVLRSGMPETRTIQTTIGLQ